MGASALLAPSHRVGGAGAFKKGRRGDFGCQNGLLHALLQAALLLPDRRHRIPLASGAKGLGAGRVAEPSHEERHLLVAVLVAQKFLLGEGLLLAGLLICVTARTALLLTRKPLIRWSFAAKFSAEFGIAEVLHSRGECDGDQHCR